MKASVKQYAQSLYELVAEKSEKDSEKLIAAFIELLNKNGDLSKAEAIIEELSRLFTEERGVLSAELTSARSLSQTAKDKLVSFLRKKTGAKEIEVMEKIQPELLGGFILRYDGYVIDGSVRSNFARFKNQLSN
ncbi:MAG: ATP synthase F1 subunit delta [Bacillota bacterium]